jgi:hypothetical protein
MIVAQHEPSPEARALTWAVLTAAAAAAASAAVTWFFADAQRRLESRPCQKCAARDADKR